MLICPSCGYEVEEHWSQCPTCGYEPAGGPGPGVPTPAGASSAPGPAVPGPPAPPGGVFSVDRKAVVAACAVGALVLIGGIVLLAGNRPAPVDHSGVSVPTAPTTDRPVEGAVALPDPSKATSTTRTTLVGGPTDDGRAPCDSRALTHSADGKRTVPCGGGFTVDFPARPNIETIPGSVPSGPVTWTKMTSTDPDVTRQNFVRYVVVYTTLPAEPSGDEARAALEAAGAFLGGAPTGGREIHGMQGIAFAGQDPRWEVSGVAFHRGSTLVALAALGYEPLDGTELPAFEQTFAWLAG